MNQLILSSYAKVPKLVAIATYSVTGQPVSTVWVVNLTTQSGAITTQSGVANLPSFGTLA